VHRHIEHARAWADSLEPAPFLDLGSGAGIPGLVLATCWPEAEGWLLDGQLRRTGWLRTAVAKLGLTDRVHVVEGRAEDLAHGPDLREQFHVVVARGFGPPATVAECGSGFVALDGVLSVSEPPGAAAKRWPAPGLERVGLEMSRQVVQPAASFVILRKRARLGDELPRRRNLPLRSPLWT
jgi:16S rRNA (guanine527-N7)-methyltransferase